MQQCNMMTHMVSVFDVDLNGTPQHCTARQKQVQPAGAAKEYSTKGSKSSSRSRSSDSSNDDLAARRRSLDSTRLPSGNPWAVSFQEDLRQQRMARQQEGCAVNEPSQEMNGHLAGPAASSRLFSEPERLYAKGLKDEDNDVEIFFVKDEPQDKPQGALASAQQQPQGATVHLRHRMGTPGPGSLDTFLGTFGSEIEDLCIIHCNENSIPFSTPLRLPPMPNEGTPDAAELPTSGLDDQSLLNSCPSSRFSAATVSSSTVQPRATVELSHFRRPSPVLPPLRPPSYVGALELPSPGDMSPMSVATSPFQSPRDSLWHTLGVPVRNPASNVEGARGLRMSAPVNQPSPGVPLTPQGSTSNRLKHNRHRRMTSYDSGLNIFPGTSMPSTPNSVTPKAKPPKSPATPGRSPLLSPAGSKFSPASSGLVPLNCKTGSLHRRGHSWSTLPALESSARVPGGHPSPRLEPVGQGGSLMSPSSSLRAPSPAYNRAPRDPSNQRKPPSSVNHLPKSASERSSSGNKTWISRQASDERIKRAPGAGTPPLPNRMLPKAHSFSDAGGAEKLGNQAPKPILVPNDGRLRRSQSLGLKVKFHRQVEVVYL